MHFVIGYQISIKNVIKGVSGIINCVLALKWTKMAIVDVFMSSPRRETTFFIFQNCLKKSLVTPPWGKDAKLPPKTPFRGFKTLKRPILGLFPIFP